MNKIRGQAEIEMQYELRRIINAKEAKIAELEERLKTPHPARDFANEFNDLLKTKDARIAELESAIKTHREQKADDRCIEDDDRLYAALHDGVKCDRRVGDKDAMLENCRRFIERRCAEGGWPSYVELEKQLAEARRANDLIWQAAKNEPCVKVSP